MTRRELRYLFIIHTLAMYQRHLIDDTNAHIEQVEAQANERLEELIARQVAADGVVLDTWQENARLLWTELEQSKRAAPKAGKPNPKKDRAGRWRVAE